MMQNGRWLGFWLCLAGLGWGLPVGAAVNSALEMQVERYIKGLRASGRIAASERTAWVVHDFSAGEKLVSINEGAAGAGSTDGQGEIGAW